MMHTSGSTLRHIPIMPYARPMHNGIFLSHSSLASLRSAWYYIYIYIYT
jgi:hypothetical protein